jgi:hypothetical protein
MPVGFIETIEPELDKAETLLEPAIRRALAHWWLPPAIQEARTPNFDIASTCLIEGRQGLLLVEAKAHCNELRKEMAGRKIHKAADGERTGAEERRLLSHGTIGNAIEEARIGLRNDTGLDWGISRDMAYQMSNRFAWAWKLTQLGCPVVLLYLGFLGASEMADQSEPFVTAEQWETEVIHHSPGVPESAWGKRWTVNGQPFMATIKALEVPLT